MPRTTGTRRRKMLARRRPKYGGGWAVSRARRYAVPGWRWHDILVLMGSIAQISERIEALGYTAPPRGTIQGWRFRNNVPTPWVPVVLQLALDGGFIGSIDNLRGPPIAASKKRRKRKATARSKPNDNGTTVDSDAAAAA